ncbi:MAG: DUF58 domain-containing protein [Bacteriovoracaceae bacterium]
MDIKAVERIVGKIQTSLFKNSNSVSIGTFKSHFRGSGLQFKEHQVYNPGDEVRFIDWKLSAKTNTTYVKTFEEERNVEILVIVDLSRSMFFGYNGISKLKAALEITCLFYLLAHESKDKVKVLLLGEEFADTPLSSGKQGITQLVNILEKLNILDEKGNVNLAYTPKKKQDDKSKLKIIKSHMARRKEIVILSDFHELVGETELKPMLYRKNLHCYCLTSPLDRATDLPFSVPAMASDDLKKKGFFVGAHSSMDKEKVVDRFGGKVLYLDVSDRYLETLVKSIR